MAHEARISLLFMFCLATLSRHVERFELGQVFPKADPEVGSLVQVVS